jgi:hypothetical protein
MPGDVTFLRQAALLLPSAFLLALLLFLVTHPRTDPGFGTYPFFEERAGAWAASAAPEVRFAAQALIFFLPSYALCLLFILAVSLGERAVFGRRSPGQRGNFSRSFAPVYNVVFLIVTAVMLHLGDRVASRHLAGTLVAPVLVAGAPFAAAAASVVPAALLAAPIALVRRMAGA